MTSLKKRYQAYNKVTILPALIYLLFSSGCASKETPFDKTESYKIDSLIKLQYVNDRTSIVKFGYDAITAIKTSEGIVIVDAGISTSLTSRYKRLIEKKIPQKNFVYVINTHGHHDHLRGNSIFTCSQIIGHEKCRIDASGTGNNADSTLIRIAEIARDYDQQLKLSRPGTKEWEDNFTQKIRYKCEYLDIRKKIPLKLPDITFPDSMNLKCGDITFEMIYFGKFHSNSDIIIFAPEIGTLFIGDLFSRYGRPNMSNSSISDVERWMQALQWMRKRTNNIDNIIDGHGQILSIDDLKLFTDNLLLKYSNYKNK